MIKNFSKLTLYSLLLKILKDWDVTTSFDKEFHTVIQRCEKKWLQTFRLHLKHYSLYTCPRVERLGENVNKSSNTTSIRPWMILYTILMLKYRLRNSKKSNFQHSSRCLYDKLLIEEILLVVFLHFFKFNNISDISRWPNWSTIF